MRRSVHIVVALYRLYASSALRMNQTPLDIDLHLGSELPKRLTMNLTVHESPTLQENFDACIDDIARNDPSYSAVHALRYKITFAWLQENWPDMPVGAKVLEFGGKGAFGTCLHHVGNHSISHPEGDYIQPHCQETPRSYDLILSMEVFEHLKDRPQAIDTYYRGNGAFNHLTEMRRLVKPNGRVLLTTPNVNSLNNMVKMFGGLDPMLYEFHTREYSLNEVRFLMAEAGLPCKITTKGTYEWSLSSNSQLETLASLGRRTFGWAEKAKDDVHGDTIFAFAAPDQPVPGPLEDRLAKLYPNRGIAVPGSNVTPTPCSMDP